MNCTSKAVPLTDIAARFGTPTYVYFKSRIDDSILPSRWRFCRAATSDLLRPQGQFQSGFAEPLGATRRWLRHRFRGELKRVIAAGGDPRKTVFSGVGKSVAEMRFALDADVLCFNVESASELKRLERVAREAGKVAPISFRVNPDVDAKTHPYISTGLKASKFGVAFSEALQLYQAAKAMPCIRITGIDCHIGSQIIQMAPLREALHRMLSLVDRWQGKASALTISMPAADSASATATRRRRHWRNTRRRSSLCSPAARRC